MMDNTAGIKERRSYMLRAVVLFAMYFFSCMLITTSGIYYVLYSNRAEAIDQIKENSLAQIKSFKVKVQIIFGSVKSDLLFLPELYEMLEYRDISNGKDENLLEKEFFEFLRDKKIYDQISYVDKSGMELINIKYNNSKSDIGIHNKLRDISDSVLFKKTISNTNDEISISPLSLAVDEGTVEIPQKPIINFGIPVLGNNNELKGAITLDYLAVNLIKNIKELNSLFRGDYYLVNQDGYWLSHVDPDKEWGFIYSDREGMKFSSEYPDLWQKIINNNYVQEDINNYIISAARLNPFEGFNENSNLPLWNLVHIVDLTELGLSRDDFNMLLIKYTLMTSIFIFVIALLLTKSTIQRNQYLAELKHSALYDSLTGLPNRKLLFERITQTIKDSHRYNYNYGLLFIDLDEFKNVNDAMGHKAGDELLQLVAQRLLRSIRASDTVARVGGDEFVIIVSHFKDTKICSDIANTILSEMQIVFNLKGGDAHIGASIGVLACESKTRNNVDDLLHIADNLMYEVKKSGKNSIKYSNIIFDNNA